MPVGTKGLFPDDLDKLTDAELAEQLKNCKAELFNLRFSAATGQLEDHGRLKAVRRDIARIYTIAHERELNIRTAPAEK
ncbi:MAG: 50S ribosomal protein L29 [Flaviflexus sp.]|nr:50S ribosomal protein L29 [Flaviflexus sp.]